MFQILPPLWHMLQLPSSGWIRRRTQNDVQSQNSIKSGGVARAIQWEGSKAFMGWGDSTTLDNLNLTTAAGSILWSHSPSDLLTLQTVITLHYEIQGEFQCTMWLKPESQNHALNTGCEKCNKTIVRMVTQHPISAGYVQETLNPRGPIIICKMLIFLTSKGWLVTAFPKL